MRPYSGLGTYPYSFGAKKPWSERHVGPSYLSTYIGQCVCKALGLRALLSESDFCSIASFALLLELVRHQTCLVCLGRSATLFLGALNVSSSQLTLKRLPEKEAS